MDLYDVMAQHRDVIVKDEFSDIYSVNGERMLNAGTSNDATFYIVSLPSNRIELWMLMESDRLANPVFREFYSERDVVTEERRMGENSPSDVMYETFMATAFDASAYGIPIVGWMSDLPYITRKDLEDYYRQHYGPNNAVALLAGDVRFEDVKRMAEKYFGPLKRVRDNAGRHDRSAPEGRAAGRAEGGREAVAGNRLPRPQGAAPRQLRARHAFVHSLRRQDEPVLQERARGTGSHARSARHVDGPGLAARPAPRHLGGPRGTRTRSRRSRPPSTPRSTASRTSPGGEGPRARVESARGGTRARAGLEHRARLLGRGGRGRSRGLADCPHRPRAAEGRHSRGRVPCRGEVPHGGEPDRRVARRRRVGRGWRGGAASRTSTSSWSGCGRFLPRSRWSSCRGSSRSTRRAARRS